MTTALAEPFYGSKPALPVGYDNGLYDLLFPEDIFLPEDMRREARPGDQHLHYDGDAMPGVEYSHWAFSDADLPITLPSLSQQPFDVSRIDGVDVSDSARSRVAAGGLHSAASTNHWTVTNHSKILANQIHGAESLEGSAGSAGSPEEKIFTPASSHQDAASPNLRDSSDDAEAELLSDTSPASSGHTRNFHVSRPRYLFGATGSASAARMNHQNLPERLHGVSGALYITTATPTTLTGTTTAYDPHWTAPTQVEAAWMDGHGDNDQYDHIDGPHFYPDFDSYEDAPAAGYAVGLPFQAIDEYALDEHAYRPMLPSPQAPLPWPHYHTEESDHATVSLQARQPISRPQIRTQDVRMGGVDYESQQTSPSLMRHVADAPVNATARAQAHAIATPRQQPAHSLREPSRDQLRPSTSSRPTKRSKDESDSPSSSVSPSRSAAIIKKSNRSYQKLVKAEPRLTQSDSPGDSATKPRKGGRTSRLSDTAKQRTADMRSNGACWKCVIQRDKVQISIYRGVFLPLIRLSYSAMEMTYASVARPDHKGHKRSILIAIERRYRISKRTFYPVSWPLSSFPLRWWI